jgi:hypothetical protein
VECRGTFLDRVSRLLETNGFHARRLVSHDKGDEGEAITFEVDKIRLRFVRDRTEGFLDVGTVDRPEEFHQFDDVCVALGWSTLEDILQKTQPEALHSVIERVRERFESLQHELTGLHQELTRAKILRANTARARELEKRLR